MAQPDDEFYSRADEHIALCNKQLGTDTRGEVSASSMYATARFNAWVSACGWGSGGEMASVKDETVEYFVTEFRKMLEDNLEDYIENFDSYMKPGK